MSTPALTRVGGPDWAGARELVRRIRIEHSLPNGGGAAQMNQLLRQLKTLPAPVVERDRDVVRDVLAGLDLELSERIVSWLSEHTERDAALQWRRVHLRQLAR